MLLNIFDPALLVYRYQDLANQLHHCFTRLEALTLHRQMIRQWGLQTAMSQALISLLWQHFAQSTPHGNQLHDLRDFMFQDMQRATIIDVQDQTPQPTLSPPSILCGCVQDNNVVQAWLGLVSACLNNPPHTNCSPQIPTWRSHEVTHWPQVITVIVANSDAPSPSQPSPIPLVWDEDSWFSQLAAISWWPDLEKCVQVHMKTNQAIRTHPCCTDSPLPFTCEPPFLDSLARYCSSKQLQRQLVKALTKLVYGVHDAGLGLERMQQQKLRFRVSDFWRVHGRDQNGQLILDMFGPHDIDGVG